MNETPRLALAYIMPQQAQKHVTHNEALDRLDMLVQASVKSHLLALPPAGPDEGDCHIVAEGAGGAWAGHDHAIARFAGGGWTFAAPDDGWIVYSQAAGVPLVFAGGAWEPLAAGLPGSVATLGVNASADAVNRLAVASDAVLFTHEGTDQRLKLNKAAPAHTASLVFQTGFSGRAEFGLAGDDDWHLKVSPDGAAWHEALVASRATGALTAPRTFTAASFAAAGAPSAAWTLDAVPGRVTLASGASLAFPIGSGLIVVNDHNASGATALFLAGGNSVVLVAQSTGSTFVAGTPGAGQVGVFHNPPTTSYAMKNNLPGAGMFGVVLLKTRSFT